MSQARALTLTFLLVTSLFGGVLAVSAASDTTMSVDQAPPINTTENASGTTGTSDRTSAPQQYTVIAASATAINQTELARYGTVGTQVDAQIELRMEPSNISAVVRLPWVRNVRPAVRPAPADVPGSSDGDSLGVEQLHEQGITGTGVKIGIIDNGFDRSNIDGNIQASVSFRETLGDTDHGTSVAQVATRTAPESQLYLASAQTGVDHQRAINYLADQDVDIIVYSIYWPALEDTGDHFLTDEIVSARQQGTLFVATTGNEAQRHWEGDFRDADRDGFLEWGPSGDERNALLDGDTTVRSGALSVYVRWEDRGSPSRYRAALYNPNTEEYIAVGEDRAFATQTNRWSRLDTTVQSQPLTLVVENTAGPPDDVVEIVFLNGPKEIERNIPSSSITAPGDVPAAVSVGAYARGAFQESGVTLYSSRGPTDDGRRGVDVVGYTNVDIGDSRPFSGTSAAAPYVGGVAALIQDRQQGDLSPAELETALTSTSDDILQSGPDTISGAGVVNAVDATGAVATPTPTPTLGVTTIQDGDRVFQGQEDIQFGSQDFDTLTGVSGDAEGQVLSPPLSRDQTTGTYSADGTSSTFSVVVDRPRILDLEIVDSNDEDIAGGSVSGATADDLTIIVEYNFGAYEGLDMTIEDSNGLEIQTQVLNRSSTQPAGVGTNTQLFSADLSNSEAGIYTVTAEGSDDFDFGSAAQSTTLEVTDDADQTVPDIAVTSQPSSPVRTNTTFDITYQITNTGGAAGAFTVTVPDTSGNISVDRFSGDVQGPNPDGSPPSTSTTSASPGQRVSVTVTYRTAQNATGTGNVTLSATPALSDATDSTTTAVEIGKPPAPSTPRERALQIANVSDPTQITQNDITIAITRRDRGQAAHGVDVTQNDITTLITLRDRA